MKHTLSRLDAKHVKDAKVVLEYWDGAQSPLIPSDAPRATSETCVLKGSLCPVHSLRSLTVFFFLFDKLGTDIRKSVLGDVFLYVLLVTGKHLFA